MTLMKFPRFNCLDSIAIVIELQQLIKLRTINEETPMLLAPGQPAGGTPYVLRTAQEYP